MNTMSLETLVITKDDWIATEGVGSAIKTAGSFIWDKLVALGKKILSIIMSLLGKIKQVALKIRDAFRKNPAKVEEMEVVYLKPNIEEYLRDLSSSFGLVQEAASFAIKNHDSMVRITNRVVGDQITNRAYAATVAVRKIHEHYPRLEQLKAKGLPTKRVDTKILSQWVQGCARQLTTLRSVVQNLNTQIGAAQKNIRAKSLRSFEQVGHACSTWLTEAANCTGYISYQVARIAAAVHVTPESK